MRIKMQTSSKTKVDKISKTERTFKQSDNSNVVTEMRDKVITAIEITKRSGVPTLYMSNPGYGKTTTICSYARKMGMHVEELIGSQYSQDEILGFQSRTNKSYLEVLEPEWYHRIMAYSEPHYEKISSGLNFTLVEEDDIKNWNEKLKESLSEKERLTKEVLENEQKILNLSGLEKDVAETSLRISKMELEKADYNYTKYKAWLDDVEWRSPRASILFLDELSTASPNVQGAILNLCFNRKIRGNKELPKDCIILSAANFKANLTGFNNLIAPELNRFCIVNLLPGSKSSDTTRASYEELGFKLVDEFLQDFKEVDLPIPEFRTDFKFDDYTNQAFLTDLRFELKKIIRKYTGVDTSRAILDFRNISFDGIYDRDDNVPEVYNFMSPRTMSYYARVVRAMCEMGINSTQKNIYESYVDGILGLGTNNWADTDPLAFLSCLTDFHNSLYDMTTTLLNKYRQNLSERKIGMERKIKTDSLFSDNRTITGKVKTIINMNEHKEFDVSDPIVTSLISQVSTELLVENPIILIEKIKDICSTPEKVISFRSDLESLKQFNQVLMDNDKDGSYTPVTSAIKQELDNWEFYYTELANVSYGDESNIA